MPSNSNKLEPNVDCGDGSDDEEVIADIVKSDERHGGESKLAIIQSMIKQVRNGTPIYRVQLPIFLQEPRSLLERYSDFCSHMELFTSVADIADPEARFLSVVKFYLAGWHSRPKELRNPFNPILGEIFKSRFEHPDSTTHYIAEQISHHPPSTAFSIINDTKGMYLSAFMRPSFRFKGNSLDTTLHGKLAGHCRKFQEDYEITFPRFVVRGLVFGCLNLTLCGSAKIYCPQSGYSAEMEFRSKGFFSGKPNYVTANIKHAKHKKALYTIEGRWDDVLNITNTKSKETTCFFDCHTSPRMTALVAPISEQGENESRRVWHKVVHNIALNNETDALKEKTIVEEHQRALERDRKAKEITWVPKLFCQVEEDFFVYKSFPQISSIFSK